MEPIEAGLCERCVWTRVVPTRRGPVYRRCARAEHDPAMARYPRLPVTVCAGYEPAGGESARTRSSS